MDTLLRFRWQNWSFFVGWNAYFGRLVCIQIQVISQLLNLCLVDNIEAFLTCASSQITFVKGSVANRAFHLIHTAGTEEVPSSSSSSSRSVVFPLASDCIFPSLSIFAPCVSALVASSRLVVGFGCLGFYVWARSFSFVRFDSSYFE